MSRHFNNAEIGALLIAVGEQMINHDLIFGAVIDGGSKDQLKVEIHDQLVNGTDYDSETANQVADQLLELSYGDVIEQLGG